MGEAGGYPPSRRIRRQVSPARPSGTGMALDQARHHDTDRHPARRARAGTAPPSTGKVSRCPRAGVQYARAAHLAVSAADPGARWNGQKTRSILAPLRLAEALLEQTHVYRLWQAPFAAAKLAPVLAHNDVTRARRVLDVGCGPGTNTPYFLHAEYVGIDINPRYVAWARRRYGREFVAADIRTYAFPDDRRFDFVLVSSFLHHVDAGEARRILAAVARTLAPGGSVHILELLLPEAPSLARWLARHDRGGFARRLEEWRSLFAALFAIELFEPYAVGGLGVPLWHMVYCKGRAKG